MKKMILISLALCTGSTFAAQQPAVKISRANCYAPLPEWLNLPGVGYYSESLSYDRLFANHKLRVASYQSRSTNIIRNYFYPANSTTSFGTTWRAYAGTTDSTSLGWKVQGNHEEILDSGQYLQSNTSATGCNIFQW